MKNFKLIIFTLLTFYSCISYATTNNTQTKANILTKANPTFTLKLPSNPTTGYSWFIVNYDNSLLTLQKHQYVAPNNANKNNKTRIGQGGYEIWQFKATTAALQVPRIIAIKLIYARPWEIKTNKIPGDIEVKTIYVVTIPKEYK